MEDELLVQGNGGRRDQLLGFQGDRIRTGDEIEKIGGNPIALNQGEVPVPICSSCNSVMVLVLSFLAPLEYINIYDRALYLFVCNNSECNNKQWELLRSQINPAPQAKETKVEKSLVENIATTKTDNENDDDWFGAGGDSWVSQSTSISDIEALLEARDKTLDNVSTNKTQEVPKSKQEKASKNQTKKSNKGMGYYIEWEAEDTSKDSYISQKEQQIIAEQQKDYNDVEWQDEEYEVSADKSWDKFTKVLNKYPSQIIRYGGKPVWYQNHRQMESITIPRCTYCDSLRTFEFQVMPTIVEMLESLSIHVEFGTVVCFTCSSSCATDGRYHKEYIIKQESL